MIIDAHTHIGRSKHINATAYQLLKSMDESSIDKSMVFAGVGGATNTWVLDQVNYHSDRLLPVASVSLENMYKYSMPGSSDMTLAGLMKALDTGKFVAVKLYTGYEHYSPASTQVYTVLNHISKYKIPVIFHSGDCLSSIKNAKLRYSQPLDVDEVAVDHSDINFIIAHLGFPWHRDAAEVCYKNKNVYADISGFVYGVFNNSDLIKFNQVLKEFTDICSDSKLLFGSDYPISDQQSYVQSINDLWGPSAAERLSKNTEALFKL